MRSDRGYPEGFPDVPEDDPAPQVSRRDKVTAAVRAFWHKRGIRWQLAKAIALVSLLPPLWYFLEWYGLFISNLTLSVAFWMVVVFPRLRSWLDELFRHPDGASDGFKIIGIVLVFLFFFTSYWTGPWLHWFWFFFYINSGFFIYLLLAIAVLGLYAWLRVNWNIERKYEHQEGYAEYRAAMKRHRRQVFFMRILSGVFFIGLLGYIFYAPAASKATLAQGTPYTQVQVLEAQSNARYLPYEVAEYCVTTYWADSRFAAGEINPSDENGELIWGASRVPNGFFNSFGNNANGVELVRPDPSGCAKETRAADFKYGEGMRVTDNLEAQLLHRNFWTATPLVYYVTDKVSGELIGLAPYVGFELDWPLLYRVADWNGVYVIHASGLIEDLTPEQALQDPRFAGHRIFPEQLARKIGDAWGYRDGVWNAWVTRNEVSQVSEIPGTDNQQPYLIPASGGADWQLTLQPVTSGKGLFGVLNIDARTGDVQFFRSTTGELIGSTQAVDVVKNKFSGLTWIDQEAEGARAGTNDAIEPRAAVRGENQIYWMVSITDAKHSLVNTTAFVNAQDRSDVRTVCSSDEVKEFLAGTYEGSDQLCGLQNRSGGVTLNVAPEVIPEVLREAARVLEGAPR